MFCLQLLSHYRLSPHRGTTLGDKLRASLGISVLVSIPSFYLKYRLCTNSGYVRLMGQIPASVFNVCTAFSVDIILCHFKFPGYAQEHAVFHQIRPQQMQPLDLNGDLSKHGCLKPAFRSHLPSSEFLPDMIRCLIFSAHFYSGSESIASKVSQWLFEIWMIEEGDHCALHNASRNLLAVNISAPVTELKDGWQSKKGQSLPPLHFIVFSHSVIASEAHFLIPATLTAVK